MKTMRTGSKDVVANVWSDEAREASAAARRAGASGKTKEDKAAMRASLKRGLPGIDYEKTQRMSFASRETYDTAMKAGGEAEAATSRAVKDHNEGAHTSAAERHDVASQWYRKLAREAESRGHKDVAERYHSVAWRHDQESAKHSAVADQPQSQRASAWKSLNAGGKINTGATTSRVKGPSEGFRKSQSAVRKGFRVGNAI